MLKKYKQKKTFVQGDPNELKDNQFLVEDRGVNINGVPNIKLYIRNKAGKVTPIGGGEASNASLKNSLWYSVTNQITNYHLVSMLDNLVDSEGAGYLDQATIIHDETDYFEASVIVSCPLNPPAKNQSLLSTQFFIYPTEGSQRVVLHGYIQVGLVSTGEATPTGVAGSALIGDDYARITITEVNYDGNDQGILFVYLTVKIISNQREFIDYIKSYIHPSK